MEKLLNKKVSIVLDSQEIKYLNCILLDFDDKFIKVDEVGKILLVNINKILTIEEL